MNTNAAAWIITTSVLKMLGRAALVCVVVGGITATGCAPAMGEDIVAFLQADAAYGEVPEGPGRVDAIYLHARALTGSDAGALELLGGLAVHRGARLEHPFNTGLTAEGPLSRNDRTGHFFSQALWQCQDRSRLIPMAKFLGYVWEFIGEVKSWFAGGDGFDWYDIWANRLGREFGRRVYTNHTGRTVLPSEVIQDAELFRPVGKKGAGYFILTDLSERTMASTIK